MLNRLKTVSMLPVMLILCLFFLTGCESEKEKTENVNNSGTAPEIQIVVENNLAEIQEVESIEDGQESSGDIQSESGEDTESVEESNTGSGDLSENVGEESSENDTNADTEGEITDDMGASDESTDSDNVSENTAPAYTGTATIVIDAGHQIKGNNEKEPVGPGATETKAKVSGGTSGRFSGIPEYQVNLNVAILLKNKLLAKGYNVIMVRETNEVNISNSERAAIANSNNADVFIRIHCNGSDNSTANGAMTICPTKNNPYCAGIYDQSRKLSDCVLEAICAESGCRREKVWETDTMSGINWCQVPVTIVEMGYMTNQTEDMKLADPAYQDKMAEGMVKGIEKYLASR